MPDHRSDQRDVVVARALERAVSAVKTGPHEAEETRAILLTGILDAAERGVRDEDVLTDAALTALALYDDSEMDAVMRTAPL
jgi:hypothetical protein